METPASPESIEPEPDQPLDRRPILPDGTQDKRCQHLRDDGERCKAPATRATGLCAGHSRLGAASDPIEAQRLATEAKKRKAELREEAERVARMTVQQRLAHEVEANAGDIAAAYLEAVRTGTADAKRRADAADALLTRVFGRPQETLQVGAVTHGGGLLATMSDGEKMALLRRLAREEATIELEAAEPEPEGLTRTTLEPSSSS